MCLSCCPEQWVSAVFAGLPFKAQQGIVGHLQGSDGRKRKHGNSMGPPVQSSAYHQPIGALPDALPTSRGSRDQSLTPLLLSKPGDTAEPVVSRQQLPGQVSLKQLISNGGSLQPLHGAQGTLSSGRLSTAREPSIAATVQEVHLLGGSAPAGGGSSPLGTWALHMSDGSLGPAASLAIILHSSHSCLVQPSSLTHEGAKEQVPWLQGASRRIRQHPLSMCRARISSKQCMTALAA
jgi:hypothetical protein